MPTHTTEDRKVNLALDIGNTAVKAGIFERERLLKTIRFNHLNFQRIIHLITRYRIEHVIVSSVTQEGIPAPKRFRRYVTTLTELTRETPLPFDNQYETPQTLGNDRLAAVAGGHTLHPNNHVLVIDAGTALTFDFLHQSGSYWGGNISPGLNLRFEALHQATGRLPLVRPQENAPIIGNNTRQAILAGVQNGIIYEMNQYIRHYTKTYGRVKVLLTGGDCFFFDNKLNYPIFVEPNLVLIGLNKILKYNIYER